MKKNKTIEVLSSEIKIKTIEQNDFICITDKGKRLMNHESHEKHEKGMEAMKGEIKRLVVIAMQGLEAAKMLAFMFVPFVSFVVGKCEDEA